MWKPRMVHSTYPAPGRTLALPGPLARLIFSYLWEENKTKQKDNHFKMFRQENTSIFWGSLVTQRNLGNSYLGHIGDCWKREGKHLEKLLSPFQQRRSALTAPNQSWAPATRAEWRGQRPKESIRIQGIPWFMVSEWEVWEQIYLESTKLDWTAFFSALLIFAPKNTIEVDQSSNFHFLIAHGR